MPTPLTEEDSTKLFNEVSQAMREDDSNKLSSLLAEESPEEEQPDPETPADDEEVDEPEEKEDEEPESPQPEEKDADTPEEKEELSPEAKRLAELEAQLEAAKRDNQALRSQAGRVPSIQRKLAELDKKLAELNAQAPSSQTSTKIQPKVEELLKDVRETDPALADSIAKALGVAIEGLDEELRTSKLKSLTEARENAAREYLEEQRDRLLAAYPNAPKVFASPHWAEWKNSQPSHIQDLANSDSADAVGMAFELYAKAMIEKHPELAGKNDSPVVENDKAKKLEEERQRKKKDSVDLGNRRTPAKDREPTDPQALFEKFSQQIAKELKGE